MKKRLVSLLATFVFVCLRSFGLTDYMLTANDGNIVPESPRAARFLEVTAPRAALVTGATQFDVPLYTLSVQELNLTFALKYLSNGIKVFDDPCPVSYGWNLMPALRVTRRINGRPDELFPFIVDTEGYNGSSSLTYTQAYRCVVDSGLWNLDHYTSVNRYDAEKDIFTIHLPDRNITCIADFKNGTPRFVTVNADDIRIEGDEKLTYIKVTDNKGTVYTFGRRGEYCVTDLYCNEWLLTEITMLSGDKVLFTWSKNDHSGKNHRELAPNVLSHVMKPGGGSNYSLQRGEDAYNPLVQMGDFHNQLELEKVTFPGGTIALSYTRSAKGPHLTDFVVRNDQNQTVKSATLTYHNLLLRTVDISGVGQYDFGYYEYHDANKYGQDLWGFYNGDNKASTIIPEMELRPETDVQFMSSQGSARYTDENYMRHQLLRRVVYPTGGYTEWNHEVHRFAPATPNTYIKQFVKDVTFDRGGGLRVKSITTAADSTDLKPIVTNYVYGKDGNGLANCSAFPFLYTFVTGMYHDIAVWDTSGEPGSFLSPVLASIYHSHDLTIGITSNYLRYKEGCVPIWYSQVTELTGEGKTEHYFEKLIEDNHVSSIWLDCIPQGQYAMASKGPLETKTIYYKGSGNNFTKISTVESQYKTIIFNNQYYIGWAIRRNLGQLQSDDEHIIPDWGESGSVVLEAKDIGWPTTAYRLVAIRHAPEHLTDVYLCNGYGMWLQQERLVSQTTTQHFDNGDVTSSVSFEYLDGSETPSKVTATLPDGSTRVVDLHYPVNGNSNWERMIDLNLGHTPVRSTLTENISGKTSVKTVANNYSLFGSKSIPRVSNTSAWRGNSSPVVLGEYTYDNRGNLLSRLTRDSVLTTWEWDSNGLYPVSQTVGDRFVTAFEWKDLVGMTSQTSPYRNEDKVCIRLRGTARHRKP